MLDQRLNNKTDISNGYSNYKSILFNIICRNDIFYCWNYLWNFILDFLNIWELLNILYFLCFSWLIVYQSLICSQLNRSLCISRAQIQPEFTEAMIQLIPGDASYLKQFVISKMQQYKQMKSEWRSNVYLRRSNVQVKYICIL